MKKYEFTSKTIQLGEKKLYQIKKISTGELGEWIEKEENLSHAGDAWVSGDARVLGPGKIL